LQTTAVTSDAKDVGLYANAVWWVHRMKYLL